MTPSHDDRPTYPAPAEGMKFSEPEWLDLQAEDRHAGAAVVGLMASIFSVGLCIYITVALIVGGFM